ncbi:MAG: hypothetical protein AVDCRST_MAG93-6131, partial [uncultured Chloroflexia bacterium]
MTEAEPERSTKRSGPLVRRVHASLPDEPIYTW